MSRSVTNRPVRDVTQLILDNVTREREMLYQSGAVALIQQELSEQNKRIYRAPSGSWDWSWDHHAEARINRGQKADGPRFGWDTEGRDTPKGREECDLDMDAGPWPPLAAVRPEGSLVDLADRTTLPDISRRK